MGKYYHTVLSPWHYIYLRVKNETIALSSALSQITLGLENNSFLEVVICKIVLHTIDHGVKFYQSKKEA